MLRLVVILAFLACLANAAIAPSKTYCNEQSDNYHAGSHSCYYISDQKLTWNGHIDMCKSRGGNSASIPDQDTQDFVASLVDASNVEDRYLWLALNAYQMGKLKWIDGETSTYRNWAGGSAGGSFYNTVGAMGNYEGSNHKWITAYPNSRSGGICRFKL